MSQTVVVQFRDRLGPVTYTVENVDRVWVEDHVLFVKRVAATGGVVGFPLDAVLMWDRHES